MEHNNMWLGLLGQMKRLNATIYVEDLVIHNGIHWIRYEITGFYFYG